MTRNHRALARTSNGRGAGGSASSAERYSAARGQRAIRGTVAARRRERTCPTKQRTSRGYGTKFGI